MIKDEEEKDLIESLEKDEWVSVISKSKKEQYEKYAKNTLCKRKRINIRLTERDFEKIKVKAAEEGLPYQSLISMLIHKYNEGKVFTR